MHVAAADSSFPVGVWSNGNSVDNSGCGCRGIWTEQGEIREQQPSLFGRSLAGGE